MALTAKQVNSISKAGRYTDRDGLILNVKPGGSKSWLFRMQKNGQRREFGLGSVKDVSLAEAREKGVELRKSVIAGLDPVIELQKAEIGIPTFETAARAVYEEQKAGWKNPKHRRQWISTLERYAFPGLGRMRVDQIEARDIRDTLAKIWLGPGRPA